MSKEVCKNDKWEHTQIYAGDNTWYNAGSTKAIQRPSPYSQGDWTKQWKDWIALRPN